MGSVQEDFRGAVLGQLRANRAKITEDYAKVFSAYAELLDHLVALSAHQQRFRKDTGEGEGGGDDAALRKEFLELGRQKGLNDQQLIETKRRLEERETEIAALRKGTEDAVATVAALNNRICLLEADLAAHKEAEQLLRDEHLALHTTCSGLEARNRQVEEENHLLIERWKESKEKEIDMMNAQVEEVQRKQRQQLQQEIAVAGARSVPVLDDVTMGLEAMDAGGLGGLGVSVLPAHCRLRFEAHENEVTSLCWAPSAKRFASGGADRQIKVWEVHENGRHDRITALAGCNQSVMSLDWDMDETQILGACNDFTSRVWTVADARSRHTLTGHSGKVLASAFVARSTQVVSGSHDRTIKQWDLRSARCVKTLFVGSSCNDLVAVEDRGSAIISGHMDKKLRFWDMRVDQASSEVPLAGKVTSLSLSIDRNYLLACTRNDSLSLLDLRTNSVLHTYAGESFRVGFDYSRATLSPDAQYCAAGSADGSVFVWNVDSTKIESVLTKGGHEGKSIVACDWQPNGLGLLSADSKKTVCYWAEY